MTEVTNPVVGAEFQKELHDHLWNTVIETAALVMKTVNQAGYLPLTEPPKGLAAQVAEGVANMQAIIAQGGPQTNRQQKFVRDWLKARSKLNGNSNTPS